jgi:hypothetical protein
VCGPYSRSPGEAGHVPNWLICARTRAHARARSAAPNSDLVGLERSVPLSSSRYAMSVPDGGAVSAGMRSPISYSLTLVPALRRSSVITAPAAARAPQDVR